MISKHGAWEDDDKSYTYNADLTHLLEVSFFYFKKLASSEIKMLLFHDSHLIFSLV